MNQATTLLDLWLAHKWLPLFALVVSWLTALCSKESLFPVSFSKRWLPLVVLGLSMGASGVKAVIAGDTWGAWALHSALTTFLALGGYAVVVKSVFGDNPPTWMKVLALIFDDQPAKKDDGSKGGAIATLLVLVGLSCCVIANTTACKAGTGDIIVKDLSPAASCIVGALAEGGTSDPMVIVAECAGTTIADVIKVIGDLLDNAPKTPAMDGSVGVATTPWRAHLVVVLQNAYAAKAKQ